MNTVTIPKSGEIMKKCSNELCGRVFRAANDKETECPDCLRLRKLGLLK